MNGKGGNGRRWGCDGGVDTGLRKSWDLKLGLSVHGHLIQKDLPMDVVVQTSLFICIPRMDI